jgi:hypothetical protein
MAAVAKMPEEQKLPKFHPLLLAGEALVLLILGFVLLSGCWRAPFLPYDDIEHVLGNPHVTPGAGLLETFKPQVKHTYFPVTELSYQLDRALFESWLPGLWNLGSYAPGLRFMTCLYHLLAAVVLGLALRRLGLTAAQAFFCAAVFAGHPLMCEVVDWVSERKTALAGLFGFCALLALLTDKERPWRLPLAAFLYALALLSKPSALGLLPLFMILEWLAPSDPTPWFKYAARTLPFVALSAAAIFINLACEGNNIVQAPGGSIFTAMLTDLEILARYLFNALCPFRLSAVYYVEPGRSLFEWRVLIFGVLLAGTVALTIWRARRRRLAILGWLWFLAGLGPNLNLVSIGHLMQDRYLYFSLPGLLLVLMEVTAGMQARLKLTAAVAFLVLLAVLSYERSPVWNSMYNIFRDAVAKEPLAAFAHYGLGNACAQKALEIESGTLSDKLKLFARKQWEEALRCPDVTQMGSFSDMALNVGDDYYARRDFTGAEKYWRLAANPPPEVPARPALQMQALERLNKLRP